MCFPGRDEAPIVWVLTTKDKWFAIQPFEGQPRRRGHADRRLVRDNPSSLDTLETTSSFGPVQPQQELRASNSCHGGAGELDQAYYEEVSSPTRNGGSPRCLPRRS